MHVTETLSFKSEIKYKHIEIINKLLNINALSKSNSSFDKTMNDYLLI